MKCLAIVILMLTSIHLVYPERTSWWEADGNDFSNSILKITSHGILRDEKGKIVYPTNWDTKSYTSTAPPLLEHGKKYTFTISFQNMTSETFQGDIYLTIRGGILNEEGNGYQENVRKDIVMLNNIVILPKENKEFIVQFDTILTQIPEGSYKIFYKLREGQFKKQIPTPDLLNDYDKNVLQDLVIGKNSYNKHLKNLKKAQKAQDEEASELRNKYNEKTDDSETVNKDETSSLKERGGSNPPYGPHFITVDKRRYDDGFDIISRHENHYRNILAYIKR